MKKKTLLRVCGKDIRVTGRVIRVARLDGDKYVFPTILRQCVKVCGDRARIDLFTFLQPLTEIRGNTRITPSEITWRFSRSRPLTIGGIINSAPTLAIVPARLGKEALCSARWPSTRISSREFAKSTMRRLSAREKRFPHYGMTLEQARRYASTFPDQSIWIGAFLGDQMIGFVKLVTDESRSQACMVHILSMIQHKDKAPTNALIAQAVKSCADRAIPHLVYENFSYGNKQGDSLSHFKEVNGFQRVDLPRYYMPLTSIGSLALQLRLHRRVVDRFPEPLAAKLREIRTSWYNRRFRLAKDAS